MRIALSDGGWVQICEGFAPDHEELMRGLLAELPLRQETVKLFGKTHLTPRLTGLFGEPGLRYRYSGQTFEPLPFTRRLAAIRDRVAAGCSVRFNSVLVNHYRDGADGMGAHADDEPELGPRRDDVRIGSLSLGGHRRFVLKHRERPERHEWSLGEGSLFVMGGTLQRHYKHHVPKTKRAVEPRLNLTFRVIREASHP